MKSTLKKGLMTAFVVILAALGNAQATVQVFEEFSRIDYDGDNYNNGSGTIITTGNISEHLVITGTSFTATIKQGYGPYWGGTPYEESELYITSYQDCYGYIGWKDRYDQPADFDLSSGNTFTPIPLQFTYNEKTAALHVSFGGVPLISTMLGQDYVPVESFNALKVVFHITSSDMGGGYGLENIQINDAAMIGAWGLSNGNDPYSLINADLTVVFLGDEIPFNNLKANLSVDPDYFNCLPDYHTAWVEIIGLQATVVPEPSTFMLFITGAVVLFALNKSGRRHVRKEKV